MRKQGKNNVKIARKTARGPMKAMVSPSILKVNLSHLAYFDTLGAHTLWHNLPMCGRYKLSRRKEIIEEHFDSVSGEEDWNPR
jgi:hypothetical protein